MPTYGKKKLQLGKHKRSKAQEIVDAEAPIEALSPDEALDEATEGDTAETPPAVSLATPFTGDVVSPAFKGLTVIPRVATGEVAILRGFLRYFSLTEPFIGAISTRSSFMHKKGGRLL